MNASGESASRYFEKTDPASGEVLARYPVSGKKTVADAVERSRQAGLAWKATPPAKRAEVLRAVAEKLYRQAESMAALVSRETGKPPADALQADVGTAINILNYYAGIGPRLLSPRSIAPDWVSLLTGRNHREVRHPHGVVAVITPWNYPLAIAASGMAAALMAGNTVILKPSELSPAVGEALAGVFREILCGKECPEDAVQLLHGDGETGAALVDADIDAAIFTGSHTVGFQVQQKLVAQGKWASLELGGSDPMIILPQVRGNMLEAAASYAVWGRFVNAGQACAAVKRLYVPAPMLPELVELLRAKTLALRIGPPTDPHSQVGPMISQKQRQLLDELVRDATQRGAHAVVGGHMLDVPGYFYAPTLLVDVPQDARILHEEAFGPALPIIPYESLEEAIRMANATPFGLTASVFGPADAARQVANQLECGTVVINDVGASNYAMIAAGWSGWKQSGSGTSHGPRALLEMTRTQVVSHNRLFGWPVFGKPLWHFSCAPCSTRDARAIFDLAVARRLWSPAIGLAVWRNRAGKKL